MADNRDERGFVLVTSLVVLMILTVMLIGLYYRGKANQDTGLAEAHATQAFYLAEAGLNYVTWALYMDPNNTGSDNDKSLDGDSVADNIELESVPDQVRPIWVTARTVAPWASGLKPPPRSFCSCSPWSTSRWRVCRRRASWAARRSRRGRAT